MKRLILPILAALALAGCSGIAKDVPAPVAITADAIGYYCRMDVREHVGPKGQIHLDGLPVPLFFSQVKDTLAYLHMPEQNYAVSVAYVQDMATAKSWAEPGEWIAVDKAVYVVGSDRMGGMDAPEFVPFSTTEAAHAFIGEHGGRVMTFDEIGPEDVLAPSDHEVESGPDDDIDARLEKLSRNSEGH